MTRVSAFRGSWKPNSRPFVSLTPDVYVSIQGETTVVACGECRREINVSKYITGVSTEASVDSPPGSATVTLSVPDTDVNDFFVDGRLVLISMMEIEIFAKGYYTVGGFPQYYRIFWGLISSVTKSWSNGVTTVQVQCKDILRWWELTNFSTNAAWTDQDKTQSGWSMFGNYFAAMNPYTVIIALAREAMGDFSITQGSFTSFRPEDGAEQGVVAQYAKDIMAYWQLKFGNIWNSLVLYGSSGQAYTFEGVPGDVSPMKISRQIFDQEDRNLALNAETSLFKVQPGEIAAFKKEISRAAEINFFQTDTQSKLQIALTARDQAGGYEFYCDPTGDIVFKPPFYNMNVLPNKPVSWIQDFEIIEDSITDNEEGVITHVTSHGNAFGGTTDWGLNSDITTPRTGVIDWHLLKRYGWRRQDVQVDWAGDPKKLFYHLLDQIDKINSKRESGNIVIPMRPELRMGFPVWIPKYDSFFYVSGVSHGFSVGGQATTTLTLTARRGKFVAPKNIGRITSGKGKGSPFKNPTTGKVTVQQESSYIINFPSNVGETIGLTETGQDADYGGPMVLRDPKTGKMLGFPNVVMVYRQTLDGQVLSRILQQSGSTKGAKPKAQDKQSAEGTKFNYEQVVNSTLAKLADSRRASIVDSLRRNRYEAGMTNAGLYDYAHDMAGDFLEFSVIPADKISWDPSNSVTETLTAEQKKDRKDRLDKIVKSLEKDRAIALLAVKVAKADELSVSKALATLKKKNPPKANEISPEARQLQTAFELASFHTADVTAELKKIEDQISASRSESANIRKLSSINVMVRPVSDEFGFEVIGHYRYGRGAFIDRGQVQIADASKAGGNPQTSVNKLDIQFAAQGGLLTDNPVLGNLGPSSGNFAEIFEKMSPDDYVTGASFKGSNYQTGTPVPELSVVGQSTYTNSINNARTKSGHAVFAEVDAIRRAVTLAELSPSMSTGGPKGLGSVGYNRCACALGKTTWLSVLPQSLLRQLLGPVLSTPAGSAQDAQAANLAAGPGPGAGSIAGVVGQGIAADASILTASVLGNSFTLEAPGGFFEVLRNYLVDKFKVEYNQNSRREQFDRSGGRSVSRPDDGADQGNRVSDPQSPLFQKAAAGDPDAIRALQGEANFNFGRTEASIKEFKQTFTSGGPQDQLGAAIHGLPGSIFDASKGGLINAPDVSSGPSRPASSKKPQFQPPGRIPKVGETINPGAQGESGFRV